jgi:hypothetical protein
MKEKPVESIFMKRSKKIGVVGEGHGVFLWLPLQGCYGSPEQSFPNSI